MAEAIRTRFNKSHRNAALDKIIELTTKAHDNPLARIKAFETLAKHGWPHEQFGETDDGNPIIPAKVILELHRTT